MNEVAVKAPEINAGATSATAAKRLSYWLTAVLLLAFSLRILLLDGQSIWWDEGISLHLAGSSITDLAIDRLNNIHPPLYFIILKGWLSLVGFGVFAGRYLSVIASWLQVVVIYALARRWFGKRTGFAALLLAAFSAVSIIYGQEIRAYALLALIYLLLLAVTHELTRRDRAGLEQSSGMWLALGLLMWLGLHLHYIVIFVVAYVSAWALVVFVWQQRWTDLRRWLLVLYLVALASLPWFLAVWRNWTAVSGEAAAGTFGTDPAPLSYLISQVWVFHLTGLAGALARPGVAQLAGVAAILLLLLVLLRLAQKETRGNTAALLAHWLIPLSSALAVWMVRSFSHPRYVSMFVPGLILLVAYIAFPPQAQRGRRLFGISRILSLILVLAILISSLWGLWLYFVDPDVTKDDVRGVARYLEAEAKGNDLILVPDTDWSLPFEYHGEAAIGMPGLDDSESKWTHLAALTMGVDRVHVVDYPNGTRDWQGLLPFALGKAGTFVSEKDFNGLTVRSYVLDEPIGEPEMHPNRVTFGPLMLTGSWIEQDGFAGDALVVGLRWSLAGPMDENAQISLRLLDDASWPVTAADDLLVDEYGRPSSYWSTTAPITTYHVVELPTGLPPFAYELALHVYVADGMEIKPLNILDEHGAPMGQSTILGASHVAYKHDVQRSNQGNLPMAPWDETVQFAPGLTLLAADAATGAASPGDDLTVLLLWQAASGRSPELRPELALVQDNVDLNVNEDDPVYGKYPVAVWDDGEQVFERRLLSIPAEAAGAANLVLRLGDNELVLGAVDIQAQESDFTQPPTAYQMDAVFDGAFRLVGFDLPKLVFSEGEVIPVTLVWQSVTGSSVVDYVVFAHLLDEEGKLIAQHDSSPANGSRRTTGWVAGEYISDEHPISFAESSYKGQGQLEIGLYDPLSGKRLLLADGLDYLILPVKVTIE